MVALKKRGQPLAIRKQHTGKHTSSVWDSIFYRTRPSSEYWICLGAQSIRILYIEKAVVMLEVRKKMNKIMVVVTVKK